MTIIEEMTIPANDLGRFVQAQDELFCDYGQALKEVQEGYHPLDMVHIPTAQSFGA